MVIVYSTRYGFYQGEHYSEWNKYCNKYFVPDNHISICIENINAGGHRNN